MGYPVEKKVKAATAGAYLGSAAVLEVLTEIRDQPALVSFLPGWAGPIALALLPALVTGVAGWQAAHTPRVEGDPEEGAA